MDIEKEIAETKEKIQNFVRELQMLEQARNEKTTQLVKTQGMLEAFIKIKENS